MFISSYNNNLLASHFNIKKKKTYSLKILLANTLLSREKQLEKIQWMFGLKSCPIYII